MAQQRQKTYNNAPIVIFPKSNNLECYFLTRLTRNSNQKATTIGVILFTTIPYRDKYDDDDNTDADPVTA